MHYSCCSVLPFLFCVGFTVVPCRSVYHRCMRLKVKLVCSVSYEFHPINLIEKRIALTTVLIHKNENVTLPFQRNHFFLIYGQKINRSCLSGVHTVMSMNWIFLIFVFFCFFFSRRFFYNFTSFNLYWRFRCR